MNQRLTLILLCIYLTAPLYGQDRPGTTVDKVVNLPNKLFEKINDRLTGIEDKLVQATEKTLRRLAKQEERLKKKLARKDSAAAANIFGTTASAYSQLQKAIQSPDQLLNPKKAGDYLPEFDSVKNLLGFLQENPQLSATNIPQDVLKPATAVSNKLKQVAEIRKILKNRRNMLSEQLSQYGLSAQLKKLNKEIYYYNQYVQHYKSLLNDPSRLEQTALSMLNKLPAFRDFTQKHSFIAALFPSGDNLSFNVGNNTMPALPRLQTREAVNQLINVNNITTNAGGQDIGSQYLGKIKQELAKLKSRSSSWDEDASLPNFKPNEMKTKSFWGKLEPGFNFQFGKSNSLLPTTADIGAQVAYRFHQNGSVGIGTAYKLGMGSIQRIAFSHQGISARSFFDYKLKGSFFANAGFEYNYNTAFRDINELKQYNSWQSSALSGISKKYKLSKKVKGNLVILYDFLHKQHIPNTQPLVFRFGYHF